MLVNRKTKPRRAGTTLTGCEDFVLVRIGHRPDEAKGSPGIGRRVGGEIETVGVAPVPEDQRTQKPWQMFIVWLMASASATTPLIGLLLFKFGLTYLIAAIVVSWLIGFISTTALDREGKRVRAYATRAHGAREDRQDGVQGSRHDRASARRMPGPRRPGGACSSISRRVIPLA